MTQGGRAGVSVVKPPYAQIKVGSKTAPEQVGQLEQSSERVDPVKSAQHGHDRCDQEQQPEKRKQVGLISEEPDAPQGVEQQLQYKDAER